MAEHHEPDDNLPTMATMRRLWERMAGMFPGKWVRDCGAMPQHPDGTTTTAGDTWRRGLAGLTNRQISSGLNACLFAALEWPPSQPRFRQMCVGVPTLAETRQALIASERSDWTALVWRHVDPFRIRKADAWQADRMIAEAYELAHKTAMTAGRIPPAPAPLPTPPPAPPPEPAEPETVARCMAEIEQLLGCDLAPEPKPDDTNTDDTRDGEDA